MLPILWPEKEEPNKIWDELMKHGEKLFWEKIAEVERNRAQTFLAGMKKELEKYDSALEAWKGNKNPQTAALVKQEFNDAGDFIDTKLEELKLEGYQTRLLTCYAQAALMHLNLLQQGVVFGDEWNKNSPSLQKSGLSDYWYNLLMKRIEEYIDYCTKTYNEGLNKLKNAANVNWNSYNTYRRDMTLMVLDLIALFPLYDVRKYNIGGKTELTREVYTDALTNGVMDSRTNVNECENSLTRKPHLFSWLNGLHFAAEKISYRNNLSGIKNEYILTGGLEAKVDKDWYGKGSNKLSSFTVGGPITTKLEFLRNRETNGDPNAINSIKSTMVDDSVLKSLQIFSAGNAVRRMTQTDNIQPIKKECNLTDAQPCGEIGDKYSHALSYALIFRKEFPYANAYYMYSFAWTHDSVSRENNIAENRITQIPAVKAMDKNDDFSVIEGPGHTGGDLVKLSGRSEEGLHIKCLFENNTKGYRVRLRYAANKDTKVDIIWPESGGNSERGIEVKKTYSENDCEKYKAFQYLEARADIVARGKYSVITIKNALSDTSILIDKIEFIPLED